MPTWALVLLGLLIVAGLIVAFLAMAAQRTTRKLVSNVFDSSWRPDAEGRYPNEPGYVDPDPDAA